MEDYWALTLYARQIDDSSFDATDFEGVSHDALSHVAS